MNKNNVLENLRELESLLLKHRVTYVSVIREFRQKLERSNDSAELSSVEGDLRRMFMGGGMGSLSDVWISQRNGHVVEDETAANRRLDSLRESLRKNVQKP